ncbi:PhzF family phenazine biosynthesis protein [Paraliobacillus zengyii]|uniref:PhzF family phenazine biosynthesis protein n=1 Tax=Paraliobacillus zengyii TaxID=2213194 RepID=UPI000DD491BF|nr:PhzF family phenazine biosynthesis protein [Paraliobacillus zengyii]
MKPVTVYHYDAFSSEKNKGNPAGVVLDTEGLKEVDMQKIALEVGFNETVFVGPSSVADYHLRFFTPGHEMPLCGHATIASIYALQTKGILKDKVDITIETKAGILPIYIVDDPSAKRIYIKMEQIAPKFKDFNGSKQELAESMGLLVEDIDHDLPIVYGNTGTWTLLVPIKKLASFVEMNPDNNRFPAILNEMPRVSVHPFCFETHDAKATMHARHFSSPFSGTKEDAVTGTASGVMGAYYATYVAPASSEFNLIVEQGLEMNKDGRVHVYVKKKQAELAVSIQGTAVYVTSFIVKI